MAIVSSVRKGQLLAERFAIDSPKLLLQALKSRGRLGRNSEAVKQYQKLVELRVGKLVPAGGDQAEFRLLRSEENERALDLALELVSSGEMRGAEVNQEACVALQKDERYINHLLSASELKKRDKGEMDAETKKQIDQLIFGFVSP
jgi:hypothetical protein